MTKSMIATEGKSKATIALRAKARCKADKHAQQERGRLIGDLPVGRLAGKYRDDPVLAAIMDAIHAETEAELAALNQASTPSR